MESFGHAIVEAMSAADAPPMNEHVGEDRGALYAVNHPTPHAFAAKWQIDEASLEQTVRGVMAMSWDEKQAKGRAARGHYLAATGRFRADLLREWREIVES